MRSALEEVATLIDAYGRWWLVLGVVLISLMIANEVGYRLGRKKHEQAGSDEKAVTGVMVGAVLALLGLLLAFSFSIVESRFAERKALVLDDANAISTAYLRAKTVPEPYGANLRRQMTEYVRLRLRPEDPDALAKALIESPKLQNEMWAEMVQIAAQEPLSEVAGLFEASLNEMIDLHESRVAVGLYQRLPRAILITLYAVSLLGMLVLGYGAGLGRSRLLLATTVLVLAVSSVVVVIVELDRPGTKLFDVNQGAMKDVYQMMVQDQEQAGRVSQAPPHD